MSAETARAEALPSCSPSEFGELIANASRPFVIEGMLDTWKAREWTASALGRRYAHLKTTVRLRPLDGRGALVWETECAYVSATLGEFSEWLATTSNSTTEHSAGERGGGDSKSGEGSSGDGNSGDGSGGLSGCGGLSRFPRDRYVGYADYQDMPKLFEGEQEALSAVDWRALGISRNGSDSSLWLGSRGAHTLAHYDAYGDNLVAQLDGIKRWRLKPPGPPGHAQIGERHGERHGTAAQVRLTETRVPYEESSIFASTAHYLEEGNTQVGTVEGTRPQGTPPPGRPGSLEEDEQTIVVDLKPGQVLFVPQHWWHEVTTLSPNALSVNTWIETSYDSRNRIKEALVRIVASSLLALDADEECAELLAQNGARSASDAIPDGGAGGGSQERTCAVERFHRAPKRARMTDLHRGWLNPTEEIWPVRESVQALRWALRSSAAHETTLPNMATVVNAFCTGEAIECVTDALLHAVETAPRNVG